MIRVMIAATRTEVREGLITVLRLADDIELTDAAASLSSAIQQAATACPDVALIDLEMPEGEGCLLIRQLKRLYPHIKSIALTAHDYPAAWQSAIQAGAYQVIVKGLAVAEMVAAIKQVANRG